MLGGYPPSGGEVATQKVKRRPYTSPKRSEQQKGFSGTPRMGPHQATENHEQHRSDKQKDLKDSQELREGYPPGMLLCHFDELASPHAPLFGLIRNFSPVERLL